MSPAIAALAVAAALVSPPAIAMTDAELLDIVTQRLKGDRTGACFAVAVVGEGERVARAYACAQSHEPLRVNASTAFEIGSVSKTMTAALLADLIAKGKGSLDDRLADWLPPDATVPAFEGQPILLRHVVSHRSGLPVLPPGMAIVDPADPYAPVTPAALLASLESTTLSRPPGSDFEYSNFASMLLSYAVARRAGTDFETLLKQVLFTPLQMRGAYVSTPPGDVTPALGHLPNGQPTAAWTFEPDIAGVGGVRATLDDMVRYVQAQLGDAPDPLAAALTLSQQPVAVEAPPAMAMNWLLEPLNGHTVYGHEGGTGGFSSLVAFDRARQRGVVVLSDTALHSLGGLGDLGMHLLDPTMPLGKPRLATPADEAALDGLVGDYRLEGGPALSLRRQGQALVLQAEGQPPFELGHDDAGDFYPLAFDALLKPHRRADGSYAFTWFQGGAALSASRVGGDALPGMQYSAVELQGFAGDFLLMPGFSLKVFERGGELYVQGTDQPEVAARAIAADAFLVESVGAELRFDRGADGKVSAVTLLQGGQSLRGEKQ